MNRQLTLQVLFSNLLLFLVCTAPNIHAQDQVTFFEIQSDVAFKQAPETHEISRSYIQIESEELQMALHVGTILNFSLTESDHAFEIQRVSRYTDSTISIIAKALDGQRDYLAFTIEEEQLTGKMHLNQFQDLYHFEYDREMQTNYVMEVNTSELDVHYCEVDHQHHEIEKLMQGLPEWEHDMSGEGTTFEESSGTTDVDIMIVYTQRANSWMNNRSSRNQVIAQAMNLSQMVMDNSQIPVNLNLVHTHRTNYNEGNEEGSELLRRFTASPSFNNWGNEYDGYMEEIHDIRDQHNADLVALFAEVEEFGGWGWIRPLRPEYGFTVNRVQQMDNTYTLVHEFGHNFGSEHSRNQQSAPAREIGHRDYSTGWRWTGNDGNGYVSVMTYREGDEQVPYFSNPDINYQGVPTGSYSGEYAPADNARSITETRHIIAAYRTEAPDVPSKPELASPSNGSSGQNRNPVLRWSESERAEDYRIQVSESSNFNSTVVNRRTTNLQFEVSNTLDFETTYYWRVRASNEGGNSNWSNTWSFSTKIAPPEIVILVSPQNNGESITIDPVFEWEDSERADFYSFQISENQNFTDLIYDEELTSTSYEIPSSLLYETQYFWRVNAENSTGKSGWGEEWSFKTENFPIPQNLVLIDENEEINLEWDEVESSELINYWIFTGESIDNLDTLATVSSETTFFNDKPAKSSFYALKAEYEQGGKSEFSNVAGVMVDEYVVKDDWELISSPQKESTYQLSNSQIFSFDRIYQRANDILPGYGYWVRGDANERIEIRGEALLELGLNLQEGWNLVGGLSDRSPVSSILDPDNILTDAPVFYYNQGSYHQASELEPGIGYWIYAAEEGPIRLEAGAPQVREKQMKMLVNEESEFYHLYFENENSTQDFWISEQPLTAEQKIRFVLPPKAPEPGLDVRSSAGYAISRQHSDQIEITSTSWPIEVTMTAPENSDPDYIYRITGKNSTDEVHFNLNPGQTIRINNELDYLILERVHIDETIQEYFVYPNYPNPFNPSTSIQYQLPEQSHVLVDVFNVAGQRVSTLVNQQQQAGMYTIQFDGSSHASGVYFVRFQAGSFSQIQKLTLIK